MCLPPAAEQLRYFRKHLTDLLDTIQQLVEIESPSDVKAAVDRLGTVLASRFQELGGLTHFHPAKKFGNHLEVRFRSSRRLKEKPVLLVGHMDTVYPIGTISRMPYRVSRGRVWGPGVLDMKSGIALALQATAALIQWGGKQLLRPLTVLLVSDEEVGSNSSRMITERLARRAAAVLVLEPAHGLRGALKTARKGVGEYRLRIQGKPAHAGLDFEKGQSAIVELARQILEISKLVDPGRGITVNVGKISGGTRSNVVPAEASAAIDVRVRTLADAREIGRRIAALAPFNPHCKLHLSGGLNRPPMERTPGVEALYRKAKEISREIGIEVGEASVGGGSDGNFTAALGVPTLDGLGAVGEGAHAPHESILLSELPRRAALVAGLIARI
ncbi:MAG: M20 family metallopeptidase [Acidobacteria bacterium]|nr:M20 family metallopeptidase [Acidobacteriota bacterium]